MLRNTVCGKTVLLIIEKKKRERKKSGFLGRGNIFWVPKNKKKRRENGREERLGTNVSAMRSVRHCVAIASLTLSLRNQEEEEILYNDIQVHKYI